MCGWRSRGVAIGGKKEREEYGQPKPKGEAGRKKSETNPMIVFGKHHTRVAGNRIHLYFYVEFFFIQCQPANRPLTFTVFQNNSQVRDALRPVIFQGFDSMALQAETVV